MFVSVIIEPSGMDSGRVLVDILSRYGFKKIQRTVWEKTNITEQILADLKTDIDRVTDSYDKVRFYQYPVKGCFVVTQLVSKKWSSCKMQAAPQK